MDGPLARPLMDTAATGGILCYWACSLGRIASPPVGARLM